jgi:large subunit ribosomal protein L5
MASKKNMPIVSNLKEKYLNVVIPDMINHFDYNNKMEVPNISHITINMGIGDAKDNPKKLESAIQELTLISAQKPVITKSKQDISNFKIRKGYPVGCKVTLRGNRMYDFMERLISVALPRTRDFRGLSFKSFDGRGNYSFGVKEQIIFTEINYDEIDSIRGMDITFSTTAKTNDESYWLLKFIGLPLRDKPVKKEEVDEAA